MLDLRNQIGRGIDPYARVRVYSAMIHPNDQPARERIHETATAPSIPASTESTTLREASSGVGAALSGSMLLRMIQIQEDGGFVPSLNAASFLISELWPKDWQTDPEMGHLRGRGSGRHRQRHLKKWHEYRSVAHLWAAFLLPQYFDPDAPTFLDRDGDLVEFLHVADYLAVRGSKIFLQRPKGGSRERAMDRKSTVRFELPAAHRSDPNWAPALPCLTDRELRALESSGAKKRAGK